MYRQYEDPYMLEKELIEVKKELAKARKTDAPDGALEDLMFEIAYLEDRINFAWQDDEAETEGWY